MKRYLLLVLFMVAASVQADYDKGLKCYEDQNYECALKEFSAAADHGNARAQVGLGLMYANGQGVKQDYAEAMKWFRLAADDAFAQAGLGFMYQNGQGVKQDHAEAMKWFRLAADQGMAEAQFNLGSMYANGEGVKQDYVEAIKWYRLAAGQGDANAQYLLGVMYEQGKGVRQDKKIAKEWFGKVCDGGLQEGCNGYRILNEAGISVP